MSNAASVFYPQSAFDAFLFASVGEDGGERQFTVLSALARLNLDPWLEAAELNRLPFESATKRLTSLIATLPDGVSHPIDQGTAPRLIALLPRRAASALPAAKTLHGIPAITKSPLFIWGVFLTALLLGAVFIVVYR